MTLDDLLQRARQVIRHRRTDADDLTSRRAAEEEPRRGTARHGTWLVGEQHPPAGVVGKERVCVDAHQRVVVHWSLRRPRHGSGPMIPSGSPDWLALVVRRPWTPVRLPAKPRPIKSARVAAREMGT